MASLLHSSYEHAGNVVRTLADFILNYFWPEDPALKASRVATEAYKRYQESNQKGDLDEAITNFTSCLALHLQHRDKCNSQSSSPGEPSKLHSAEELRALNEEIANTYLNYCIAIIERYTMFGKTAEDGKLVVTVEEGLSKEWSKERPMSYAPMMFNLGNIYSQMYYDALSSAAQASAQQAVFDDPQKAFDKFTNMYGRIFQLQNDQGGVTDDIKRKALIKCGKMYFFTHVNLETSRIPVQDTDRNEIRATNLTMALRCFDEARRFFSAPVEFLSDSMKIEYRDYLNDLASTYSRIYQENDSDIRSLNKALETYALMQQIHIIGSNNADPARTRCLHDFAHDLYKRYEYLKRTTKAKKRIPGSVLANNRVVIGLEDLKKAMELEKQVQNTLTSLGDDEIERLKLEDVKASSTKLLVIIDKRIRAYATHA